MRDKFLTAVFLFLFLGFLFSAQAQTEPALLNFIGKVSSINAESGEITIVTSEGSSFTINTKNASEIRQVPAGETTLQNSTSISFSQISLSDWVLIRGKLFDRNIIFPKQIVIIKKLDTDKRDAQRREDWKKRGIAGTVTQVDPLKKKISVQIKGRPQLVDIFLPSNVAIQRFRTNATSLNDFQISNIEEIKEGNQIRALGDKSSDGLQFYAVEVFVGSITTNIGRVVSTDPQNNELRIIVDSLNKTISVTVNSESNIRRITQDLAGKGHAYATDGRVNLTSLLEKLPKVSIPDIKVGETVAVASSSSPGSEKVIGLIVVIGIDILRNQASTKSSAAPNKNFNLDVF